MKNTGLPYKVIALLAMAAILVIAWGMGQFIASAPYQTGGLRFMPDRKYIYSTYDYGPCVAFEIPGFTYPRSWLHHSARP